MSQIFKPQSGGAAPVQTLSDDVGTIVTPSGNNIQLVGHVNEQTGKFSTVVAGTHLININPMSASRWIVDALGFNGTHTTITAAMASAQSGDTIFVLPGTYTENFTITPGVNLVAFANDAVTPNVIISGKVTMSGAGTSTISNIRLQTNNDYCLAVTGSAASVLKLFGCHINCTNHTGISLTSSSSNSQILPMNCYGNLATTGIAYFDHSGAGDLNMQYCVFNNSGGSTTANTVSGSGFWHCFYSSIVNPTTSSGSSTVDLELSDFDTIPINATCLTVGGTGGNNALTSNFSSGTAVTISINSSLDMDDCAVYSTGTTAITGSGTLNYQNISCTGSTQVINTSIQTGGIIKGGVFQNPSIGFLGEQIRGTGSSVSVSNNSPTTICSVSLTAGVWDISVLAKTSFTGNGTAMQLAVSANNNSFTGTVDGDSILQMNDATSGGSISLSIPAFRVVLTTNTTYYNVVANFFSTGTSTASGRISATRVG